MSYHKQAKSINDKFIECTDNMSDDERYKLINAILYFGQVAKFRCRSNTAYDSFSKLCFEGLANLERKDTGLGFPVLQVKDK